MGWCVPGNKQDSPVYAYERKKYVLFNLTMEAKNLQHGIRDYIVDQMKGRHIEGSVLRGYSDEYGQHLVLCVTGEPETLETLENDLIYDGTYWLNFDNNFPIQPRRKFTHGQFSICRSFRGAECGPNSDAEVDNRSEHSASRAKSAKAKSDEV
mgnify:FL=1